MRIVFAASECVPFAKTGGLADVVGALAPELVKLGHEVTVYLPFYSVVREQITSRGQIRRRVDYDPLQGLQPVCGNCGWRRIEWSEVLLCRLPGVV